MVSLPREVVEGATVALALALLVAAQRHAISEEDEGFAGAAAHLLGFAKSERYFSQWATHPGLEVFIPQGAFLTVAGGVAVGLMGFAPGFAFGAAFALADKALSHKWLGLPGDFEWPAAAVALGLLLLRFDLIGALAGVGALVAFLGGLWAVGKVRRWAE